MIRMRDTCDLAVIVSSIVRRRHSVDRLLRVTDKEGPILPIGADIAPGRVFPRFH
jgi:hypothetical protein